MLIIHGPIRNDLKRVDDMDMLRTVSKKKRNEKRRKEERNLQLDEKGIVEITVTTAAYITRHSRSGLSFLFVDCLRRCLPLFCLVVISRPRSGSLTSFSS